MLFEVKADPHERHNVMAEQFAVAAEMRRQSREIFDSGETAEALAQTDSELSPKEQAIIEAKRRDLGYLRSDNGEGWPMHPAHGQSRCEKLGGRGSSSQAPCC
jgi:hypothetical protein